MINTESSCSSCFFSLQSKKQSCQQHSRSDQYCSPAAEMKTSYSYIPFKTCCYSHPAWRGDHIWNMIHTVQYYRSLVRNTCMYLFTLRWWCTCKQHQQNREEYTRDVIWVKYRAPWIHILPDSFNLRQGQVSVNNPPILPCFWRWAVTGELETRWNSHAGLIPG